MTSKALRLQADEENEPVVGARSRERPAPVGAADALDRAPADPMTVLLVTPTLDAGAAAGNVRGIAGILDRAGHQAIVVSRGNREGFSERNHAGKRLPVDVASRNPFVMLANVVRLARIVRREGCDVIHAHGRAAAWSAFLAARLTRRPLVTTWYKGFREQNRLKHLYNGIMAAGDRVIAVSEQIAELIAERYKSSAGRIRVLPACVDLTRFDPGAVSPERVCAMRRAWGLDSETRVLLVAGRMLRRKGHHVVIQAARRLKGLGLRNFLCVFASPDAGTRYAGELWDQVLATETADVVRLTGPLEDMPAAYAAATLVVSAAVQPEGIQRVVLEAQAMARPVIVSDLGAGADLVLTSPAVSEDRVTGLRFPAGDAEALAALIVRLLSMPEGERVAMGMRGRAWVLASFDPDAIAAQTLALYREVVGRGPRAG